MPEENISVTENIKGGTTTHYLVPTKVLPLVQVMPFLKSREAELKAKIDKGYSPQRPRHQHRRRERPVAVEPAAQSSPDPADTVSVNDETADSPRTVAAANREAKREARAQAAAARREARAEARAEAAAKREAKREARADRRSPTGRRRAPKNADSDSSSDGSGSSDSSGSSE